jgi:hypothetical protein
VDLLCDPWIGLADSGVADTDRVVDRIPRHGPTLLTSLLART